MNTRRDQFWPWQIQQDLFVLEGRGIWRMLRKENENQKRPRKAFLLGSCWNYEPKKNPSKFLKIHKILNVPNESFGFIMPKSSVHSQYINEFFESGFGFTATKVYHQILEKYLGNEIIESVEIK